MLRGLLRNDRFVGTLAFDLIERSAGDERNFHRAEVPGVGGRIQFELWNRRRAVDVAFYPHRIRVHSLLQERKP